MTDAPDAYNGGVAHARTAPPRSLHLAVVTAAAVWLALAATREGASAQSPDTVPSTAPTSASRSDRRPSACHITTAERTVAVGDVHGGYDQLVAILRAANIIDAQDRWSAGRTVFVQTGDVVDRGPDSRRALDLLHRLEGEAVLAGGAVHALLGNHEAMRLMRDLRYVSPEEYAAFRTPTSEALRERYYDVLVEDTRAMGQTLDEPTFRRRFLAAIPPGYVEMQIAFEAAGPYGQWIRSHDTMARVNDVVFLHGGVTREVAALGCDVVNERVRAELAMNRSLDDPALATSLSVGPNGPLWYRGLALDTPGVTSAYVDDVLDALGARTIVIGHTTTRGFRIRQRHGTRVIQIDTGMLGGRFFPGGRPSALEIHDGTFTAIYLDRRELLFERDATPAPVAEPATVAPAR